jgi:ribosomal protein S12 methylthiotransferase accessory factor
VQITLQGLFDAGILESADETGAGILSLDEVRRLRPQIAFFSHFVVPAGIDAVPSPTGTIPRSGIEYQERLKQSNVAVFGMGRLGSQLVRSLAAAGVGTITAIDQQSPAADEFIADGWLDENEPGTDRVGVAGKLCTAVNPGLKFRTAEPPNDQQALIRLLDECDFAVLCPDHTNPAEYAAFNTTALASKTMWTSARFAGFEFHIGPTVIPRETPCFECLRLRISSNIADYGEHAQLEEYLTHHRLRDVSLALTPGAGLLALEVLKGVTWFAAPATYARLYVLNLLTMQSELHPILKIPRCPACGRPAMPRPTVHAWQQTQADPLT